MGLDALSTVLLHHSLTMTATGIIGLSQVMNMLIGVLVEVVSVTAQVDKEETAMKARDEQLVDDGRQ